jgi:hypothetical protein
LTAVLDATEQDNGAADALRGKRSRMCAVTRTVLPEGELIRFVAAPDGSMVADLKRKLPGRGVWVSLDRGRVTEAVRKNVFARALKQPVRPAADLPDQVAARLKEATLGRLGLARKAGAAVTGFAKVEAAVGTTSLGALLVAADAAADSVRKMEQVFRRRPADLPKAPMLRQFLSEELGLALGAPNVIHAAVLQSPAGTSFVEAAIRLQRYDGVGADRSEEQRIDEAAEPRDMTE